MRGVECNRFRPAAWPSCVLREARPPAAARLQDQPRRAAAGHRPITCGNRSRGLRLPLLRSPCDAQGQSSRGFLMTGRLLALLFWTLPFAASAHAAQCGGDFNAFIAAISREATAQGVSRAVIDQAFAGVAQDPGVLAFDRRQRGTFRKSFEEYAATRVTAGRISRGRQMMQRHAALLQRIEQRSACRRRSDRRDLGPGDRFRHRRHGQAAGGPRRRHDGA